MDEQLEQLDRFIRLLSQGRDLTNDELGEELGAIVCEIEADEVRSFEEAGVLTSNDGYVVTLANGAEYQITIVPAKGAWT